MLQPCVGEVTFLLLCRASSWYTTSPGLLIHHCLLAIPINSLFRHVSGAFYCSFHSDSHQQR